MSETPVTPPDDTADNTSAPGNASAAVVAPQAGPVSQWLRQQGFEHEVLAADHVGVEQVGVEPAVLPIIAAALKSNGFDYLQCQGGYDEGPGERLVCFYHLLAMAEQVEAMAKDPAAKLREVRLKVFLSREGTPALPSIYGLFRGADWQERETFDMYGIHFEGHPHPKRLLMPEDWKGWPLRKDYVQPDFYEMQDAY
jgi:NAD(P)H-quinone oxidoreductase subunit J